MASLPKLRGALDWPVWIGSLEAYSRMLDQELWDQINPENTAPVVHETMPKLPETMDQHSLLLFDIKLKRFDQVQERKRQLYGMIMESLAFAPRNVLRDPGWPKEGLRGLIKAVKKAIVPDDNFLKRLFINEWDRHTQQTINASSAAVSYISKGISLFYDCTTCNIFTSNLSKVHAAENLIAPIAHLGSYQYHEFRKAIKEKEAIEDRTITTDEIIDLLRKYSADLWLMDFMSNPPHQARSSRRR